MKVKLFITVISVMLLSGGLSLAQQADDPSLWIEVRDEHGAPLKNACVTVVPREGEILFRKADGRGRVRIKRLTRGQYRVTAKVDGYTAQKKEVLMGAAGTQGETVTFSLQPRSGQ